MLSSLQRLRLHNNLYGESGEAVMVEDDKNY